MIYAETVFLEGVKHLRNSKKDRKRRCQDFHCIEINKQMLLNFELFINHFYLFKQLWVSVRLFVSMYVTLFIKKIVAFWVSWLRGKASCAKHSLGRGAPLAPWMPSLLNSTLSLSQSESFSQMLLCIVNASNKRLVLFCNNFPFSFEASAWLMMDGKIFLYTHLH